MSKTSEIKDKANMPLECQVLMTGFGDENKCNDTILKVNDITMKSTKILMIPGMLGVGGELYNHIVAKVNSPANILQMYKTTECKNIEEVVNPIIDDVLKLFEDDENFVLVAHSFGPLVALKVANTLENKGKRGKLILVDGSPDFMYKVAHQMICDSGTDESLRERIVKNLITINFMDASENVMSKVFERPSWDGRIEALHEFMGDVNYSAKYVEKLLLTGLLERLKMCLKIDETCLQTLKSSSITLLKSSEIAFMPLDEDLGLKKFSDSHINVQVIEGGHITVLRNPEVAETLKQLN